MAKRLPLRTDAQKKFARILSSFSQTRSVWSTWQDFIDLYAHSISVVAAFTPKDIEEHVDSVQRIISKYNKNEKEHLVELTLLTANALTANPRQDFLGELYMGLDFGRSWSGQFFTPWHVAHAMALMVCQGDIDKQNGRHFFSVHDPACGAGCMLLAAAAAYNDSKSEHDYRTDMLFTGQDIDATVAKMCYIQLSLLDCAGYVVIGDSLAHPLQGTELSPHIDPYYGTILYTPMWNSELWQYRRALEAMKYAEAQEMAVQQGDAAHAAEKAKPGSGDSNRTAKKKANKTGG